MREGSFEHKRNPADLFREYMTLERRRDDLSVAELDRWQELKALLNRHFQPGVQNAHVHQRESVRVPVRLRVSFESYGEIRQHLMTNVSRGGLFVTTPSPLPLGAVMRLRIQIGERESEIEVEGEVVSHHVGPELAGSELGMGIRFTRLSESQSKAIQELYERSLKRAVTGKPPPSARRPRT